ncbi:MAG: hypothetical protein RJQ04_17515 [Longimicrobiales bacterium]
MNRFVLVAGLVGALAACSDGAPVEQRFAVRDSSGTSIAESSGPRWVSGGEWRVDSVAVRTLTGAGDAFTFFRVADAMRLADGGVVVLDGGTSEVRFFDASGAHRRTVGREGDGPGEFRRLSAVAPFGGDSLFVYDETARRATVLTPAGEVGRVLSVEGDLQIAELLPLDGTALVGKAWSLAGFASTAGPYREEYVVVTLDRTGRVTDTLTTLPAWNGYKVNREGGGYSDFAPLFPVDGHLAVAPDGVVLGRADRMEFARMGRSGDSRRIVRAPVLDRGLTPREIEAERAAMMRPGTSARVREVVDRLPAQELRPGYRDLQVDAEGAVWLEAYRSPRLEADDPAEWHVFDPDGAWLGTVSTPARFRVLDIGRDYVLGVRRDSLDVERVELLGLSR